MTVSASIPAAVISMAVLKLFKESNILEYNVAQTCASAGESLAAGVVFTLPAMVLLGYWNTFDYTWVCAIAGVGGLLGVLFSVPLRRSLIVEEALKFPEGTAIGELLRIVARLGVGVKRLAIAATLGALTKLAETGFHLWPGAIQSAGYAGSSTIGYVGSNLSAALISVGYIVGLNVALLVFLGGAISWQLAIPIYSTFFLESDPALAAQFAAGASAENLAWAIWNTKIRYLGVGAMLIGGIWTLLSLRGSLLSGIRSGLRPRTGHTEAGYDHTQHDAPMRLVMWCVAACVVPVYLICQSIIGTVGVAAAMTVFVMTTAFLFASVAGYMAGVVGSSSNPVSGMTIATIVFASLLLWLMGGDAASGPAAALLIGAVVCSSAAISGDNLQDLKAGRLIGATPWRQQVMQIVGVVSAVLVMAPFLNLLVDAYGIGAPTDEHPNPLLAPQANLMASVVDGIFGGGLPWGMVAMGVLIGAVCIAADEFLKARGSGWRAPVLAVAVGTYLPLGVSVPILVGGLVAHFAARYNRRQGGDVEGRARQGMLVACGLITGEALLGIFMAIPIVLTGDRFVFALGIELPAVVGLVAVLGLVGYLYRAATRD